MKKAESTLWNMWKNPKFFIPVILTTLLSFGFQIVNSAVSIDDLKRNIYIGGVSASQGRFISPVLKYFFGLTESLPYFEKAFSVILLVLAASLICFCFQKAASGKLHQTCLTAFACLMISYPMLSEIWTFRASDYETGLGWVLTAIALYAMLVFIEKKSKKHIVGAILLLTIAIALTEQFAILYITLVFATMILQFFYSGKYQKIREMLGGGLWFALPLVAGLILKVLIAAAVKILFALPDTTVGENAIHYFDGTPLVDLLQYMIFGFVQNYLIYALWYLPVTIFAVAAMVAFVLIFRDGIHSRKWSIAILWIGLLASTVMLMLVQGWASPYRTICTALAVFTAFVLMLLLQRALSLNGKKTFKAIFVCLICLICFWQANDMNRWSVVNNMRYEEECQVVQNVYNDLCDEVTDLSKPVVFVGEYDLSNNIKQYTSVSKDDTLYQALLRARCQLLHKDYDALYARAFPADEQYGPRFVQTNVNSLLAWAVSDTEQVQMFNFLLHNGIELVPADEAAIASAYAQAADIPCYPENGYIQESDTYILVKIGPMETAVQENNPFIF